MIRKYREPILVFLVALIAYGAVAGDRLRRRSSDPHFVAQAAAWLHGRADIDPWPAGADDPARVAQVQLDDGSLVFGKNIQSRGSFRIAGGGEVPQKRVTRVVREISYVSFPPVPSLIFLPQAAIHGDRANDVATTIVLAALVPAVLLLVLRRLREAKLLEENPRDDLWLAALLAFGSVFFFSAVQGRVWFTAHVVGVLLALLYILFSIGARSPILAGLSLGLAIGTRTPMLFMFPLFLAEAWRRARADWKAFALLLVRFGAPVVAIGLALAWYNWVRFHEWSEFGHSYLQVRQQAQIERFGLFSLHYLGRNLAVALTLLPEFSARPPYVTISGHGLALWLTTPTLVLLLWPRAKGPLHWPLWTTVAFVAAWSLFYQNSGWLQFGYRFSLDYMAFLVVLLALARRPLGRVAKVLIVLGILINLFGAITFHRFEQFYRESAAAYDCVVPH